MSVRVHLVRPYNDTDETPIRLEDLLTRKPFIARFSSAIADDRNDLSTYFVCIPMNGVADRSNGAWPMFPMDPGAPPYHSISHDYPERLVATYRFVRYLGDDEYVGFSGEVPVQRPAPATGNFVDF